MVEKLGRQFEPPPKQVRTKPATPVAAVPNFKSSPFQRFSTAGAELARPTPSCIRIDLETLQRFEVVNQQFQQKGVIFTNAIALHPSNPAFPTHAGGLNALIGSPKSGWIEAKFDQPVRLVKSRITSSRRMILVAFDHQNQPIAQTEIPESNLAGSGSPIPPNTELSLQANNIHRITFQAFDGQLTLTEFSFGF